MTYEIVYNTPGNKYESKRLVVKVSAERLALRITRLQDQGDTIESVRKSK